MTVNVIVIVIVLRIVKFKKMNIYKSPNLFIQNLQEDFHFVVNTYYPDSLRIINKAQLSIISAVDGKKTLEDISLSLGIEKAILKKFFDSLQEHEIIKYNPDFSTIKKVAEPKKLDLWIHTTNKCNLACSYCYIPTLYSSEGMTKEVREQLIRKLRETAIKRNLKTIRLRLAGGEPLSQYKKWKDLIIEAKKVFNEINCNFEIAFLTNLTILNNEILDFSIKYDVRFGVSLDGFDFYNDITRKFHNGKGSFDIIDSNINSLLQNNIKMSVSTVVTNANMSGLPALTEYLIDKNIYFRYSIVKGEYIDREQLSAYLSASYDIMEREIYNGWQFSKHHKLCDLKPSELGLQTCGSGSSGASVYVDGSVYYCHVQFGTDATISGTIFDTEHDLVQIIKSGSHYEGMKSKDCYSCNYKYVCTSGCPMYRVDGKDVNCNLYHQFIPRIFELQARERLKLILDKACHV